MGREPGRFYPLQDDLLCVVLCVVWVSELSPTHTVFELLTVVETESPCCLSQQLVPLVSYCNSHFQDSELFVVASQGLLPAIFGQCFKWQTFVLTNDQASHAIYFRLVQRS